MVASRGGALKLHGELLFLGLRVALYYRDAVLGFDFMFVL
jgi:hypothetical protein